MSNITLSIDDATALATKAFISASVDQNTAFQVARVLVQSEIDGQVGHGLIRVGSYIVQIKSGKINTKAIPSLKEVTPVVSIADADHGFSYPAITLSLDFLKKSANKYGIAISTIRHSHHFGQAGLHVEQLAEAGLIGWCCGNTPSAMAIYGGIKPFFGTNPIACAFPMPENKSPLVIDMALSVVARGKIVKAKKEGTKISPDWAVDKQGKPTTDPEEALRGSLLAIGGAKGSALALMVELYSACLTNSKLSVEADSLLEPGGTFPDLGHTFIAINPMIISEGNGYLDRVKDLLREYAIAAPQGRLPGISRLTFREKAKQQGLSISNILYEELNELAKK
ncbi:MAG: Ldh family oxidoreductase [Methylacidiphilales bacterium]|nr:Ldh family oxidoreductase [Candidatus Methylacidiphilales bacterium]